MATIIAGISYLSAALLSAYAVIKNNNSDGWKIRSVLYWFIMGIIFFIIPYKFIVVIISALFLFLFKPRNDFDKILFYIVVFPSVPLSFYYIIPFPGINYLIVANFLIVAPAVVLLGRFVLSKPANQAPEWPVFLYMILITAFSLYQLPFTSSLRFGVVHILMYFLPFIALARAPVSDKELVKFFDALLTLAVILGFLAMIFQLSNWNIYGYFDTEAKIWKYHERRYGLLRVSATVTSTSLAFLAACGIVAMSVTKSFKDGRILRHALIGVLLLTVLFSMARGGWLAAIVMLCCYRLLMSDKPNSSVVMVSAIVATLGLIYFQSTELSELDRYGTFEYRSELYKAALVQFYNNPVFGDIDYIKSGNFDHLIQGEGIIDIVSVYIDIILSYGMFGFSLIFGSYLLILWKLFKFRGALINDNKAIGDNNYIKKVAAATISMIFSYLIMIGTISDVSFVGVIGYILLGMGYSVIRELEGRASVLAEAKGREA